MPSRFNSFSSSSRPRSIFSCAFLFLEPLADFFPGAGGIDIAQVGPQPVLAGTLSAFDSHDLHDIAVIQTVVQRHQLAVDLGAHTMVPQLGMNAVGKIQRSGALGRSLISPLGV